MTLMIRYVAMSDVGLIREGNEDSGYAGPRLLAVADGMGGHAAGELASSVAIEELVQAEERHKSGTDPLKALDSALHAAHERIRELVDDDPGREGMGTTVTALLWTGDRFGMAHIGDSRGYRLRDRGLTQITTDHTFVQSLVDEGRITEDQASVHPARSMILKALQGEAEPQVDLEMLDVRPGDRYLLCSDGITDFVSTETIEQTLTGYTDLTEAASTLVQLALRAGAPDNVTLVMADVIDTEIPPDTEDTAEAYLVGAASDDPPPPPPAARRRPGSGATRPIVTDGSAQADEGGGVGTLTEDTGMVERVDDPDADDPEELRYAPRPPRRMRWLRWLGVLVILGGLIWAGLAIANDWIRGQYFVGEQGGEVAIYRGINQSVGPLSLYEYNGKPAELPVGALPEIYRNQIDETIPADSRNDAEEKVAELLGRACEAQAEPPTVLEGAEPDQDGPASGTDGSGQNQADTPNQSDASGNVNDAPTPTVTQPADTDPDTQVDQQEEQSQTSGYPGLVCPEDQ